MMSGSAVIGRGWGGLSSGLRGGRAMRTAALAGLALVVVAAGVAAFMLYGRTARGSVVSLSTGRPLAGVAISSVQGTATTNAEGRFELSGLRIGTHPVTVTAAGFAPFDATVRVGALGGAESQIAVPDAKLTVRIDEVAVDLKAADGVKVTVGGLTASRVGTGTYEITGAKPGRVTVAASGASYV
jgi:hypothetical protein